MNTLIAKSMESYKGLEDHLESVGIAPLDGPYGDSCRKLPMSRAIQKMSLPCFTIIFGHNCYTDVENSKTLQEACATVVRDAVLADCRLRKSMVNIVNSYNERRCMPSQLYKEMKARRREFKESLAMLKVGRLRAIAALNEMEGGLVYTKLAAAAHQMDKLFICPKDQALGGNDLPITLFKAIEGLLEDLSLPDADFWSEVRTTKWIMDAITDARKKYEALDTILPPSHQILAILSQAPNAIEGLLRFEHSLHELKFNVNESAENKHNAEGVLKTIFGVAAKVGNKIATLPQAAADSISGIERGSHDTYTAPVIDT